MIRVLLTKPAEEPVMLAAVAGPGCYFAYYPNDRRSVHLLVTVTNGVAWATLSCEVPARPSCVHLEVFATEKDAISTLISRGLVVYRYEDLAEVTAYIRNHLR